MTQFELQCMSSLWDAELTIVMYILKNRFFKGHMV